MAYNIWNLRTGSWVANNIIAPNAAQVLEAAAEYYSTQRDLLREGEIYIVARDGGGQREAGLFRWERVERPTFHSVRVTEVGR